MHVRLGASTIVQLEHQPETEVVRVVFPFTLVELLALFWLARLYVYTYARA